MAKAIPNHVTPKLFRFFRDLEKNNNREWFLENKKRYETDVRDPLLELITDFAPALKKISPHFMADARPVGGSLFRIYRDIRFSKDKTPYKTAAGIHFRHEDSRDVHAPGFYIHLEPGASFAGAGLWHPEARELKKVRDAIVADPAGWKRAAHGKGFREKYGLEGELLKRPPRGFDPEHPLVEDLKRKDFVSSKRFSDKEASAPGFPKALETSFKGMRPLMAFLTRAVGAPF